MRIRLGSVELGDHQKTDRWIRNLERYPSVRFFGLVHGRMFLGLIFGAKGKSQLELTQDALIETEDKLAALKREHNALLVGTSA